MRWYALALVLIFGLPIASAVCPLPPTAGDPGRSEITLAPLREGESTSTSVSYVIRHDSTPAASPYDVEFTIASAAGGFAASLGAVSKTPEVPPGVAYDENWSVPLTVQSSRQVPFGRYDTSLKAELQCEDVIDEATILIHASTAFKPGLNVLWEGTDVSMGQNEKATIQGKIVNQANVGYRLESVVRWIEGPDMAIVAPPGELHLQPFQRGTVTPVLVALSPAQNGEADFVSKYELNVTATPIVNETDLPDGPTTLVFTQVLSFHVAGVYVPGFEGAFALLAALAVVGRKAMRRA